MKQIKSRFDLHIYVYFSEDEGSSHALHLQKGEVASAMWATPRELINMGEANSILLVTPQWLPLSFLREYPTRESLKARLTSFVDSPLPRFPLIPFYIFGPQERSAPKGESQALNA